MPSVSGCVRTVIGEDSWIMGLDFVTSYFHSFATEERLSRSLSKEQLTLPQPEWRESVCSFGVGRSFTCLWQRSNPPDQARSGQMRAGCLPSLHTKLGSHPAPSAARSLWSCWPVDHIWLEVEQLLTKAAGLHCEL